MMTPPPRRTRVTEPQDAVPHLEVGVGAQAAQSHVDDNAMGLDVKQEEEHAADEPTATSFWVEFGVCKTRRVVPERMHAHFSQAPARFTCRNVSEACVGNLRRKRKH